MVVLQLKQLRKANRMTQQDVAMYLDISASAVGMYEQGRREPDLATLIKMADMFGVSVDQLIGRTGKIQP